MSPSSTRETAIGKPMAELEIGDIAALDNIAYVEEVIAFFERLASSMEAQVEEQRRQAEELTAVQRRTDDDDEWERLAGRIDDLCDSLESDAVVEYNASMIVKEAKKRLGKLKSGL